jgi:hypothetical protein
VVESERVSTSLQRTYRNLRIGIAGTVVVILVSVAITASRVGVLPSISAYYYTPARTVFVGALIAVAAAIVALSGRGLQRALLSAAGLFAPLIALVPTPLPAGAVPGYEGACPPGTNCVPAEVLPDIDVGVVTYLVVAALAVAVSVAVTSVAGTLVDALPSLAAAATVIAGVFVFWTWARDAFVMNAHLVAAVFFFGLVALTAVVNAFAPLRPGMPPRWRIAVYWVVAVAMTVDLAVVVVAASTGLGVRTMPPSILVGESVALLLFLVFWVLQSLEKWDDADPSVLAPR